MEPCGVNDEPGPVKVKALPSGTCVKCNEKKAVFLFRATESTCWECLQELLVRKFKSAVIKGRKSKRDIEKYLVAFSGGASSSALLHLLWNTSNGANTRKKIRLSVVVVHIDESALGLPKDDEETRAQTQQFLQQVQAKYGYEVYNIGLEQLYATQLTPTAIHSTPATNENNNNADLSQPNTTSNEEAKHKLTTLFSQVHTTTAKEDLQQRLRSELLQRLGAHLKVDSILLGTPADRAASLLVVNTCLGRGNGYPSADFPANSVNFLQPMREFLLKEIAAYNHHSDIQTLFIPTFSTKKPHKSSIFALSENFVSGLQADYPHTVHTLLKSEDKLTAPEHIAFNCAICRAPVRGNAPAPTQPTTTECSTSAGDCGCASGSGEGKGKEKECGTGGCGGESSEKKGPRFCYGCTRMMGDLDPSAEVCVHLLQRTAFINVAYQELLPLPVPRATLHSMIKDFLIEDDAD